MNKKRFYLFLIGILSAVTVLPVLSSTTIIDDTVISTSDINAVNLNLSGTCTGCPSGSGNVTGTISKV